MSSTARAGTPAVTVRDHIGRYDWPGLTGELDAYRLRGARTPSRRRSMPVRRRALSRGAAVPQPRQHGAARVRPRRVPLFRLSVAGPDRRSAHAALCPSRPGRERVERPPGRRDALPGGARRLPRPVPCRRPASPDAAAAAGRRRRLQLPASGPLRRSGVSAAGRDPAVGAGSRFHRRRVRADRTAAAHAEPGGGRAAAAGRCRRLRGAQPAGGGHAGGPIASIFATASAASARGTATRSASFFTTRADPRTPPPR